jgi:tetratricopeptide (TPR) repeat protein
MLFYSGKFIKMGKKLMDYALEQADEQFVMGKLNGLLSRSMYVYFSSGEFSEFDEERMFTNSIHIGEYWIPATFYVYNGYSAIESGNQHIVLHYLNRLKTLGEAFDNRFPEIQYHRLRTEFCVKYRRLDEAERINNEALAFASKTDYKMQMLLFNCLQSMAFSVMHEFDNARNSLAEAEKLLKDFRINFCHIHYLIATCYLKIEILKTDPSKIFLAREALITTKKLIKLSKKVRKSLPEVYRLRALIFRGMNHPGKTLRNLKKSIRSAQLFNGNLELARTYFEAGKFLRDPKNKKERILGMNGTECLLKAKSMFEEMNLQWDQQQYEKYMGSGS